MKVLLDLSVEYNPENDNYKKMLARYGEKDTPEAFVRWGLHCSFWGWDTPFEVVEVQSFDKTASEEK